jgi:hypothetical protein
MKHELFEELDAFHPQWRNNYATLRGAAIAAGCYELYVAWRRTDEGKACESITRDVPDYLGAVKAAQEAAERLPFNLGE